MYVCTYVRMYVCTYVRMYVCIYVCMYVRMYVSMYLCMYVCIYVCMYVCMHACMYVCIDYIYIYINIVYIIIYVNINHYIYINKSYIYIYCKYIYTYILYIYIYQPLLLGQATPIPSPSPPWRVGASQLFPWAPEAGAPSGAATGNPQSSPWVSNTKMVENDVDDLEAPTLFWTSIWFGYLLWYLGHYN